MAPPPLDLELLTANCRHEKRRQKKRTKDRGERWERDEVRREGRKVGLSTSSGHRGVY
jgi:hypothetical protein